MADLTFQVPNEDVDIVLSMFREMVDFCLVSFDLLCEWREALSGGVLTDAHREYMRQNLVHFKALVADPQYKVESPEPSQQLEPLLGETLPEYLDRVVPGILKTMITDGIIPVEPPEY